jgi:imidazolonepropionase-like amidohydrolase
MRSVNKRFLTALCTLLAISAGVVATGESVAADLVVRDVTLLDGTGAPAQAGVSVHVRDGRVFAVHPRAPRVRGATVIDGRGKFLIPGLIDTHIHLQGGRIPQPGGGVRIDRELAVRTLHGYLYSGVTSIVDQGNAADFIFGLRAEERAGTLLAPRIFATGANITVPKGYGDNPFSIKVGDFAADRPTLEAHFARRPDIQKFLYDELGTFGAPKAPVLPDDVYAAIVRLAKESGIRTTVHVVDGQGARKSLEAGIEGFSHTVRAGINEDTIALLRERRVPVSSTLAVITHIARVADHPEFLQGELFKATVEPEQLAEQQGAERQRYISSGMSARFQPMVPQMFSTARRMHESGVIVALGTDRTFGASVHMELELLHEAGIPLADLLRIATLNGAIYLGLERELGSIEPGKRADMLLLEADPRRDVAAYRRITAVFKEGRYIDRSALDVPANRRRSVE